MTSINPKRYSNQKVIVLTISREDFKKSAEKTTNGNMIEKDTMYKDICHCPIACAIRRMKGIKDVVVEPWAAKINGNRYKIVGDNGVSSFIYTSIEKALDLCIVLVKDKFL